MITDILNSAEERINSIRKNTVTIKILMNNRPVPNATVRLKQQRHQFLFGANCFGAGGYQNDYDNFKYSRYFVEIFNYATLPFYWSSYEKIRGCPNVNYIRRLVTWCKEHGLTAKGHPLVWHQTFPDWIGKEEDIKELSRRRIMDIINEFKDDVKWWDAVNEITVAGRHNNLISDWAAQEGCLDVIKETVNAVLSCDPEANLLVNEFNFSEDGALDRLLQELKENNIPVKAIGMQSHMHAGKWPLETVWRLCNRFSQFGWPIHFTELSVLSGKAIGKIDFLSQRGNKWITGDEDETAQEEYVRDFYKLLFSHPAVEAITWWDFVDGNWLEAPSGLLAKDLTPKKAYNALYQLIKKEWWTDVNGHTDIDGTFVVNAFYGKYEVSVSVNGQEITEEFNLVKAAEDKATEDNEVLFDLTNTFNRS